MQHLRLGPVVLALTFWTGCLTAPAPTEPPPKSAEVARGEHDVVESETTQARLYLFIAQKELEQGKNLMKEGKNRDAAGVLQMAQSDADLALLKAQEPSTRMAATETKSRAKALYAGATEGAIGGGPVEPPPPAEWSPVPTPVQPSGPLTPPAQSAPQPHP
jgi:hypothetical protein